LFLQGGDVLEIDEDAEIALLETEWWVGFTDKHFDFF